MRLFVAIPLPDEERRVGDLLKKIKTLSGLKPVEPENLHLTLKFLGEVKEKQVGDIIVSLENLKKRRGFNLQLKGLGVFPSQEYIKVLWIGVDSGSEEVIELQQEVDELLSSRGFKKDARFHPHFTLARVRNLTPENKGRLQSLLKEHQEASWGKFYVDEVELMKSQLTSQGPIYSVLREIEL